MLRVQLEDFGACINSFAIRRWSGRWRSTACGRVGSQEVAKELGYRMSITPGYGSIQMMLPAKRGIEMRPLKSVGQKYALPAPRQRYRLLAEPTLPLLRQEDARPTA